MSWFVRTQQRWEAATDQIPQSVMSNTRFWGLKNCVMLQVVEGKLAEGGPHWDTSMGEKAVACNTDGGTFGRC